MAHGPHAQQAKLQALFTALQSDIFEVTEKLQLDTDVDGGVADVSSLQVHLDDDKPLQYPAFIKGYACYEIQLKHHDAQTDIFCLGLVLGSMALGLDLYTAADLKLFAAHRSNPALYNERIHPVLSALVREMTELDRSKRTQDLYDTIQRLKNYRDYDPEKQTDLSNVGRLDKQRTQRKEPVYSQQTPQPPF